MITIFDKTKIKYVWFLLIILCLIGFFCIAIAREHKKTFEQGYQNGYLKAQAECNEKIAKIEQHQREQENNLLDRLNAKSKEYEQAQAENKNKEREQYAKNQKIIERVIYRNNCFDNDGLQQLNELINSRE